VSGPDATLTLGTSACEKAEDWYDSQGKIKAEWLFTACLINCSSLSSGLGVSCSHGESTAIPPEPVALTNWGIEPGPIPELYDKWILVGRGEKGEGCGELAAAYICDNPECGKPHYTVFHCRRKACPNCYGDWILHQRDKAVARLLSSESMQRNKGKRLVHIVLSPSEELKPQTHAELDLLFDEGYRYIKGKGAEGGLVIFHAFRATKEAKRKARKAGLKVWEWIRAQDNVEQWYRYSPHMHLITFVNHLKPPEKGEKWVYKTITRDKKVVDFLRKAKREKELKAVIYYLLTHAVTLKGEEDSFHSLRWFGSCGYNKFKTTREEEEVIEQPEREMKCKICGGTLIPLWKWYERWYEAMEYGDVDRCRYWDEVVDVFSGNGPPDDAEDFVV